MDLDGKKITELTSFIKDSFRVRRNHNPLYVDVGDFLSRMRSPQHQIIFGRRGSGKSCLLVHFLNTEASKKAASIYVLADEYKGLGYPDILIRLLIEIFEGIPVRYRWIKKVCRVTIPSVECAEKLRTLLDDADEADVIKDESTTTTQRGKVDVGKIGVASAGVSADTSATSVKNLSFREKKLDYLRRHLRDYKNVLQKSLKLSGFENGFVLVDDFYLFPCERQPEILDYLHSLVRDTDLYMKVATIRHRTTLATNSPQTVGVELSQDVEEINLDRTLEDLDGTQSFLRDMLSTIAKKVGLPNLMAENFNPDALQALTLASGGVPRDFLTIFTNAIDASTAEGKKKWLTPKYIYKGAGRLFYQTKLKNLHDDATEYVGGLERVLSDLLEFCLVDKKKTAFLISQEETQKYEREHALIQQLMDAKLVHVVEPDTSAASGRKGRYEAYTLDFSLFMEPRRRNIEIVEFWKIDENRRRTGIREAPVYPLERAARAFEDERRRANPEDFFDYQTTETPTEL